MHNMISGYIGSDTMPTCTENQCWYLIETPLDISADQLNFFKVAGVTSNARALNLGTTPTTKLDAAPLFSS